MPTKRTSNATGAKEVKDAKRAKLDEQDGEDKPVETSVPIPTDASLRPGDIRVQHVDDERFPHGCGVFDGALHIYPVMPTELHGDEEDALAEMEEFPAYSIPLDQLAFVQRAEDWDEDERYRLVQLQPAEEEGQPPTIQVKEITVCPFDDHYYYFDHELPKIPPSQRNFRTWLALHAPSVRFVDLSYGAPIPATERYKVNVVVNPASGNKTAKEWQTLVESLLRLARGDSYSDYHGFHRDDEGVDSWLTFSSVETAGEGDGEKIGERIAKEFKAQKGNKSRSATVVLGGDGTVHELLNGLGSVEHVKAVLAEFDRVEGIPTELVLLPLGTANALFYHLFPPTSPSASSTDTLAPLRSLLNFLESASPATSAAPASKSIRFSGPLNRHGQSMPLPLAHNTLPGGKRGKSVFTSVVTSAALHANILLDAEALRASHPGVERFKLAAQQNAQRWWSGSLRLKKDVKRYDSATRQWVDKGDEVDLDGEFAYMTAALVDRFEPTFVVAPFRSRESALSPASTTSSVAYKSPIDLVLIRPMRHAPTAALVREGKADEAKKAFVDRVWAVSGKMYDGGKHVDVVYDDQEREDKGADGKEVAEVFRCCEFEWKPTVDADKKDRIVCLDGALHDLGAGGSLKTKALGPQESKVMVWA
ncbi:hypothetical protein JCM6882_009249 [Rhodosporidiobolus microsporus]